MTEEHRKAREIADRELFRDLVVTCVEAGCSYWAHWPHVFVIEDCTGVKRRARESYSDLLIRALHDPGEKAIPIYDSENVDEKLGELSLAGMHKGIELLKSGDPDGLRRIYNEQWDADDADNWLQLSVLGEVTFS